jgi:hypothetical protein
MDGYPQKLNFLFAFVHQMETYTSCQKVEIANPPLPKQITIFSFILFMYLLDSLCLMFVEYTTTVAVVGTVGN